MSGLDRDIHRGLCRVTRDVADGIAMHVVDETLSKREIAIIRLVATGTANKQAASELGPSGETIKGHLKKIFTKPDVADRTHAVTLPAIILQVLQDQLDVWPNVRFGPDCQHSTDTDAWNATSSQ